MAIAMVVGASIGRALKFSSGFAIAGFATFEAIAPLFGYVTTPDLRILVALLGAILGAALAFKG